MYRTCSLCSEKTADDSLFCANHKARAAAFSVQFGLGNVDQSPGEGDEQAGPRHGGARKEAEGDPSVASTEEVPEGPPSKLITLLGETLERTRTRLSPEAARGRWRWTKICFYFQGGELLARAFFCAAPPAEKGSDFPDLRSEIWPRALAANSPARTELLRRFAACEGALRDKSLAALELHFVTYAGLVAICERAPEEPEHKVTLFDVDGDECVATTAADARERLGHDRW